MRRDSLRWRADVDVRAGGRSGNRSANGDKRDALRGKITDQRVSFSAVGMHGDIDGFAVIETKLVVRSGLTDRVRGRGLANFKRKKASTLPRSLSAQRDAPTNRTTRPAKHTSRGLSADILASSSAALTSATILFDFGEPPHRLGDLALGFHQRALAVLKLAFGYHVHGEQFLALSDHLHRP